MITSTAPATPDESPLAGFQRLLLLDDADRLEYLASLDVAARRAGRTRTAFESWLDEIPFHSRPLDFSSVTGKRTILGGSDAPVAWYDKEPAGDEPARVIPVKNYQQSHGLPGIYDDEPLSGGGGGSWRPELPALPGLGALLGLIPFFGPRGDTPSQNTDADPDQGINSSPGVDIPREVSPQPVPAPSPQPAQMLAAPQPAQTVPSQPILPPPPSLPPDEDDPEGTFPDAVAIQGKTIGPSITPATVSPGQTTMAGQDNPKPAGASDTSTTAGQKVFAPIDQAGVPLDRVRVRRDGGLVDIPRDKVSPDEIAAVTATANNSAPTESSTGLPATPAVGALPLPAAKAYPSENDKSGAVLDAPKTALPEPDTPTPLRPPVAGETTEYLPETLHGAFANQHVGGMLRQATAVKTVADWIRKGLARGDKVTVGTADGRVRIVSVDDNNMLYRADGEPYSPTRLFFRNNGADPVALTFEPGISSDLPKAPVAPPGTPAPSTVGLPNANGDQPTDPAVQPIRSATSTTNEPPYTRKISNGYAFDIDKLGRTVRVEGYVDVNKNQNRNVKAQKSAGGIFRLKSDEGGHLIARVLNGPTDDFNHIPQDMNLNRGRYKAMESRLRTARESGKSVLIKIFVNYPGDSLRPEGLVVVANVGGRRLYFPFRNVPKRK